MLAPLVIARSKIDIALLPALANRHGLITGALFLLVGVIYERTHDRTIAKMGGLAGITPTYVAIFGFFVFASAGLPGLSGFVGEFLVLLGAFAFNPATAAVAALVMVLGAAYLLWMFQRVATGEVSDFLKSLRGHLTDISGLEIVTLLPLGILVVVFGLLPGILLEVIKEPINDVLSDVARASEIPLDPMLVAGALGILAFVIVVRVVTLPGLRRPAAATGEIAA